MKQQQIAPKEAVTGAAVNLFARKASDQSRPTGRQILGSQENVANHSFLRHSGAGIQGKLTINQPNDQFEQEADRVAEQVMRMPADIEGAAATLGLSNHGFQRKCTCGGMPGPTCECGHLRKKRLSVQRRAVNSHEQTDVPPIVHEVLRSLGRPLDSATRSFMESRFGRDFSPVRVHTDALAGESARVVQALAYTVGTHVVFGSDRYAPHTKAGQRLLAHELAHVVQQMSDRSGPTCIQRQGRQQQSQSASSQFQVRTPVVLRHLARRDRRLANLIRGNLFNGAFMNTPIRQTINGQLHTWSIAIVWRSLGLGVNGRTVEQAELTHGAPPNVRTEHRIEIDLNPQLFVPSDPALTARFPNARDRAEFIHAENLYHELVHASLKIEARYPATATHSALYTNYQSLLTLATSAGLATQRNRVMLSLNRLITLSRSSVPIARAFEYGIDEKYTSDATSAAFAHVRSNQSIALEVANVFSNSATRALPGWDLVVGELVTAWTDFFDALDTAPRGTSPQSPAPTAGAMPGSGATP